MIPNRLDIFRKWCHGHGTFKKHGLVIQDNRHELSGYVCIDLFHEEVGGVASLDKYQMFSVGKGGIIRRDSFQEGEFRLENPQFFGLVAERVLTSLKARRRFKRQDRPIRVGSFRLVPDKDNPKEILHQEYWTFPVDQTRPSFWYPKKFERFFYV